MLWQAVFILHRLMCLLCIHKTHYDLLKLLFSFFSLKKKEALKKKSYMSVFPESQTLMKLNCPIYSIFPVLIKAIGRKWMCKNGSLYIIIH